MHSYFISDPAISIDRFLRNLCASLQSHGYPQLIVTDGPRNAIEEYFPPEAIAYGFLLAEGKREPDWHLIEWAPNPQLREYDCSPVACHSQLDALAYLLEECDRLPLYFTHAEPSAGGGIRFFSDSGLVAEISPLPFASCPTSLHSRAASALHKVSVDNFDRALHRLADIQGFEDITDISMGNVYEGNCKLLCFSPRALAWQMRRLLRDQLALEVRLHEAQEFTAAAFQSKSWNHFVSPHKKGLCTYAPAVVNGETLAGRTYYRSYPEAVAAFSLLARQYPNHRMYASWPPFTLWLAANYGPLPRYPNPAASCAYAPVQRAWAEQYNKAAAEILDSELGVSEALRLYCGASEHVERRWALSWARRYGKDARTIRIGRWLLCVISHLGHPHGIEIREVMPGEVVSTQERYVRYKEARANYARGTFLFSDHGSSELITDDWTKQQVNAFATFTGLKVKRVRSRS